MATIEAWEPARVPGEALDRIGEAMAQFAGAYVEWVPRDDLMYTPDDETDRAGYNADGVAAQVDHFTVDGMSVSEQTMRPFARGIFDTLIPADAQSWLAGFKMWRNEGDAPYNHSYFKIQYHGHEHLNLIAFSESQDRAFEIMRVGRDILRAYPPATPPAQPEDFKVFIAFGGGRAWEVVRDYLKRAGVTVDAFTEAERAGEITIDVVGEMVRSASMAVIVMTAADEMKDGTKRARQNVIHEAGFSQGALGIRNTIVLLEKGVDVPSNIAGLTYIPFNPGEIHTTEERVVRLITDRTSGI